MKICKQWVCLLYCTDFLWATYSTFSIISFFFIYSLILQSGLGSLFQLFYFCVVKFFFNRCDCRGLFFQAFAKMFKTTPDDLDMHVIYDVSHNIAKVEEHYIDGRQKTLLVHRKGSTRAFPPHHPLIPVDYQVRSTVRHCLLKAQGPHPLRWIKCWVSDAFTIHCHAAPKPVDGFF